jgi:REP element-mobilizing transposase RayT
MGHSFTSSLYHCAFSTKERRPCITAELQSRLWPFLGGIARENRMVAPAVGGVEDHIHILLSLPSTMSIAKAIQLLKAGSSLWLHEMFPEQRGFAWQEGYGAFSLSVSQAERTKSYIESQAEHHRKKTFQEEFLTFLKKHNMDYDERYVWG